jgi:hypothetical protein
MAKKHSFVEDTLFSVCDVILRYWFIVVEYVTRLASPVTSRLFSRLAGCLPSHRLRPAPLIWCDSAECPLLQKLQSVTFGRIAYGFTRCALLLRSATVTPTFVQIKLEFAPKLSSPFNVDEYEVEYRTVETDPSAQHAWQSIG